MQILPHMLSVIKAEKHAYNLLTPS